MSTFYVYLISSLPMLHFGMRPPFSWEDFLGQCQRLIPENDYALLKNLPGPGQYADYSGTQETLRHWVDFDTAWEKRVKVEIDRDLTALFIDTDSLLAAKLAAGRPEDLADVAALRRAANVITEPKKKPTKTASAKKKTPKP